MQIKFLVVAAGLAVAGCSATASDERQQLVEQGRVTGTTEDGERVRCESVRETGSRFTQRICLTEREWDDMEQNAQRLVEDRNQQGQVALPQSGSGRN